MFKKREIEERYEQKENTISTNTIKTTLKTKKWYMCKQSMNKYQCSWQHVISTFSEIETTSAGQVDTSWTPSRTIASLLLLSENGIWTVFIPKISHIYIVCHAHQDVCVTATLLTQLYVRVSICLACGKHLLDRIISIRDLEVLAHKTSLRSPLIIDVPVPSQQRKRWCIYLLGMTISTIIPFVFHFIN